MELSKESLKKTKKLLQEFKKQYLKSVSDGIRIATEAAYNKVLERCYANGIENHTSEIYWTYDENTKTGKIYSNDMVIIFNEFGTGIVGKGSPHPNPDMFGGWEYDANEHGEAGWKYPKGDGTFGWTRGLPSRRMFYDAFLDIKDEIGDIINVQIKGNISKLY